MVGKSRQQPSPITSQAGERSWPASRTGLQLQCSFQHEKEELPGINWLRLGRGKQQLRASDSGQVNWRSQMLPHELLSIPHTHSHSLADMIKQSQHCFPPGLMSLPIPHSGQPAQPEQSRQLWWNLLPTFWLSWMANQKTRTVLSTLPLTHWDIWGLGKAAYLCRPVSSSDKWSGWAVDWLTCNLMPRLSEWDDDLGEEGWKTAEEERIPVGEWPWVGL